MSKTIIPTIKLSDDDCNILFQSITDKLKIENPKFFYPIYKKVIDDDTMSSEDLHCIMLDSKFKCKQILEKIIDSDDEDNFESDDEESGGDDAESGGDDTESGSDDKESGGDANLDSNEISESTSNIKTNELLVGGSNENDSDNDSATVDDILNEKKDIDCIKTSDSVDDDNEDEYDDDAEIEEAINNTFTATAIIERTNKITGEKTCKEEKIHIKKSALLEPLKVMQDEYVIPSKIQNKNISDDTLKNTMNKLNSYNNSGHVESLFLYLGNKLVESGKCPSFPYYYGCINGDDHNYHHNITDEYETVSRTKWFRDRVKTDFDLLIIENDDIDEQEENMLNTITNTLDKTNKQSGGSDSSGCDSSSSDDDSDKEDDEKEEDAENCNAEKEEDAETCNAEKEEDAENCNDESETDNNVIIPENKNTSLEFIKDMESEDLSFEIENNDDDIVSVNATENSDANSDAHANSDDLSDNDNSFIEELSDVDKDNLSLGDFDNNINNMYYIKCETMPVSLSLMEKLDYTLDDILDDEYNMKETEWFSVLFQVAFGLSVAQKYFKFVHNDLHSSNVMFKKTSLKHLYFQVDSNYYKIPTYEKITKIIDFARGTFKFGDRWVFSDQFKEDNDAFGQYDYPVDGTLKNCEHKPNPSFDLVRLGTTVIQRLENLPKVREFIEQITMDDIGTSLCYNEDDFQLYIDIAHNCHNAVPIEVMKRPEFERFKISKNKIPKGQYVFKY
jgi:hypothetical protein